MKLLPGTVRCLSDVVEEHYISMCDFKFTASSWFDSNFAHIDHRNNRTFYDL